MNLGFVLGIDADCNRIAWGSWLGGKPRHTGTVQRYDGRGRVHGTYETRLLALFMRVAAHGGVVVSEGIFLPQTQKTAGWEERRDTHIQSFKALAEVQGELKWVARLARVEYSTVSANDWRSKTIGVLGPTEECKRLSVGRARELLGLEEEEALSDHEADALLVGEWGVEFGEGGEEV